MTDHPAATDDAYAAFAAALVDARTPSPPGLRAWNGSDPAVRFAVHRNNVAVARRQALRDTFPVLRQQLGDARFDAMAQAYLAERPPTSPVLAEIGGDLGDWLEADAQARPWPWLGDLARLERARVDAWHAADAPVATLATVAAWLAEPARLAAIRPGVHPSVTCHRSRWSVATLWHSHQADADVAEAGAVDIGRPQVALVFRDPADDVHVLPLADGTARLVDSLAAGATLGAAAAAAAGADPDVDLVAALRLLIHHGVLGAGDRGASNPGEPAGTPDPLPARSPS